MKGEIHVKIHGRYISDSLLVLEFIVTLHYNWNYFATELKVTGTKKYSIYV